jgi:type I restriction enzyme M protein
MIDNNNFKAVLIALGFEETRLLFSKHFPDGDFYLKVNFSNGQIIYPQGLTIHDATTCNLSANENFVVFECVHRLLMKGYKPKHIELEPKWKIGHGASGGKADILVRNQQDKPLLLIECKTAGKEFEKAWKDTLNDGAQLFSYVEQEKDVEFMCLYAADFDDKNKAVTTEQRIISHRDNPKILEDDLKLVPFADAKNVKERFKVWKETYQAEFTENGIFEENILPYQIGKEKYTLEVDTKTITYFDIKGKYHQFRTILRKFNVSRRENAFEVLVNLFLCKLVDEIEHPLDLKFYWKGIAYDNYFDLVDRLQALYKVGMEHFLDQQITYISNEDIDNAFGGVKEKRNAIRNYIKKIFKPLKFFQNSANCFCFIHITNKESFDKNAKILLEIIQMWQGLRLKTKQQNQFLGDMFEFFLDNGIKQSEGQFFTPMPICKFIVMSLPLTQQLQQNNHPLKVIDYACGSGHFLTEYAMQIEPLVKKYKQTEPNAYYKSIFGIEKEDRLAKVAKVSAFMYGRDEINVLDADALATIPAIQNETFDILIANPPFAVEDFLLTLDETDRLKYDLLKSVNDLGNKNIQCFFLERAKQLLAPNGTIGVIVPSSVLSNSDAMHIATREILLKYFDWVSIVELGSNTFGKTGTNTVILFLRRKPQRPEPAEQFWNRTQDFFEHWDEELQSGGGEYLDIEVVQKYCQHLEIPFAAYQHLLRGDVKAVLEHLVPTYEIFKDYKTEFDTKKSKDSKAFKAKNEAAQQADLDKLFLKYVQEVEQQKLYYFMLAHHNPQKVLLVKSPDDNKEQKAFLGYEWSGAKGNEGIKYNGGDTIFDILTPMFDPNDLHNPLKINTLIQNNFQGAAKNIPAHLQPFASFARLADLLDFSRKDFNKAISLNVKKNVGVETKWDLVRLGDVAEILIGGTPSRAISRYFEGNHLWVSISEMSGNVILDTKEKITDEGVKNSNVKLISKGTTLLSFKLSIGKTAIAGTDLYTNEAIAGLIPKDKAIVADHFLFHLFSAKQIDLSTSNNAIGQSLNSKYLRDELKIPLPPLAVQEQIVTECERIDAAASDAQAEIAAAKQAREALIINLQGQFLEKKVSEVTFINPSKSEIKHIDDNTLISFVEMASVSEEGFIAHKVDRYLKDLKKGSYTYFAENDVIIAKITPCMENGKCALATNLTTGLGLGSSEFHVFRAKKDVIYPKFLFTLLNRESVRKEAEKNFTGASGHRRVPANFYENYKIPIPPISEQTALLTAIETLESRIAAAQQVVRDAPAQKQAVMKAHL